MIKNQFALLCCCLIICSVGFSQRTISLKQAQEYMDAINRDEDFDVDALDDITYVKDVDNRLDQFVGTWAGSYDGKTFHIRFEKRIAISVSGDPDAPKWDCILGFISIHKGRGTIYTNNGAQRVGEPPRPDPTNFFGLWFQKNSNIYIMSFAGRCYNEAGDVFIRLDKNDHNKMILSFMITPDFQSNDCPGGFDPLFPLSPKTMALTKQTEPTGGQSPTRPEPTGDGAPPIR